MRRVVAVVLVIISLSGCEAFRERLVIREDGSAAYSFAIALGPEAVDQGSRLGEYDVSAARAIAETDPEQAFLDLFAADGLPAGYEASFVDDDNGGRLELTTEVNDVDDLFDPTARARAGIGFGPDMLVGTVQRGGDSWVFRSSAREAALRFLGELYAIEDPETVVLDTSSLDDLGLTTAPSIVAVVEVPGRVLDTDAHERNGNVMQWSWTLGQPFEPGISVEWDPAASDGGTNPWWLTGALAVLAGAAVGAWVLKRPTRP